MSVRVIYLLSCPSGLHYVGKTARPIIKHKWVIRRKDEKSLVVRQFNEAGHSVSTLSFCVIQQISCSHRGGKMEQKPLKAESMEGWIDFTILLVLMKNCPSCVFYTVVVPNHERMGIN